MRDRTICAELMFTEPPVPVTIKFASAAAEPFAPAPPDPVVEKLMRCMALGSVELQAAISSAAGMRSEICRKVFKRPPEGPSDAEKC